MSALAVLAGALALSACSATAGPPTHTTPDTQTRPAHHPATAPAPGPLQATVAHWQLPAPISREAVLTTGSNLELIGGLTANGTSSTAVLLLNPVTGTNQPWGRLAHASHDAAGAMLDGHSYLFGGGNTASTATVQRLRPHGVAVTAGSLPSPRSDLAAATVGTAVYLLGGYDGTTLARSVLTSTDATHYAAFASLPAPVRYPAIAVLGGVIWVFGGQSGTGLTDVIQRVNVATGRASVAGHLPSPLSAAAAVVLRGQIYLCGGTTPAGPTAAILRFDPSTGRTHLAGRLPTPLSNAATAVIANTGYLLGGETPAVTPAVIVLQQRPGPTTAGTP